MSGEIPLEIIHLRDRLRQDFTDWLPEARFGNNEEKERNFLSRALAAFVRVEPAVAQPAPPQVRT